jgi:hypothetical protein
VLLQLVVPAHNDLLMAGLMVAGVSLGLDRHPLLGIAVCALAATVKLPAIIAVAFIAIVWIRTEAAWGGQIKRGFAAAGITVAVLALVTLHPRARPAGHHARHRSELDDREALERCRRGGELSHIPRRPAHAVLRG